MSSYKLIPAISPEKIPDKDKYVATVARKGLSPLRTALKGAGDEDGWAFEK